MLLKKPPVNLPEIGSYQGVVFAIYDGGLQNDNFNPGEKVHKLKIGIELNDEYVDGPYKGSRKTRYPEFNAGLNKKLRSAIEAILSRPMTQDELDGFDPAVLIGKNCNIAISHKISKSTGNPYAVDTISPLTKGMQRMEPILKPNYMPDFILKWINSGEKLIGESVHGIDETDPFNQYDEKQYY